MRKKYKKLTACAVAAMLGLSCMVYPVHAEEVQSSEQTDTGGLLEVDETAVPMEESTEPEATPTPEVGEMVTAPEEDKEEFTSESVETEQEVDEPESVTQEQVENKADKEETVSEPAETEQEVQPEATEQTKVEAEPQEQTEVQENAVPLADTNTFNINNDSVNITQDGTYTINGTGQTTSNTISVTGDNITATITLDNVNIDVSTQEQVKAFFAKDYEQSNVHLTIILQGTNSLKSSQYWAGLTWNNTDDNSTLEIKGNGSLIATGGNYGAGIGSSWNNNGTKNITITDGTIIATGGAWAACIGSGAGGSGKNITITGGTVTATNIGSVENGSSDNITITGGTVTATNIGSVKGNSSNKITITGGSVSAKNICATPTDDKGNNVYLAKLAKQNDVNQVTVDSAENKKIFTRAGNHPNGDTAFYLYLTGENHDLQIGSNYYKALYNSGNFTIQSASKPDMPTVEIDTSKTTASSITVKELKNQDVYGEAEYKIADREWQDSNVFENLHSTEYGGDNYTIYARYKGNDSYIHSDAKSISNVSTSAADYTITIPAEPVEAGNSESKAELKPSDSFDVGYGGTATVKIKENSGVDNGGKLTLTRQGDTGKHTITSALLVDNTALGDINKSVATFTMNSKTPVSVSFAKPTETNIPAGTYNGTITFVVSYSEQ